MALSETAIHDALTTLPGWAYSDGMIAKTYQLPTYLAGVAFASAVGTLCEGMNHHPDMHISYKKVTVTFTTHDDGNVVTDKDVAAARKVEELGYPA
jgi:4a-hydroxytetrahydrobiopterin dehydratase